MKLLVKTCNFIKERFPDESFSGNYWKILRITTLGIVIRSCFLSVEIFKVENSNQVGGVLIMSVINQIYKN